MAPTSKLQHISILTLNCQGLRDRSKRSVLFSWLNCVKPDIVCLQETHCVSQAEFLTWIQHESDTSNNLRRFRGLSSPGTCRSRGSAILHTDALSVVSSVSDHCGRSQIVHFSLGDVTFQLANIYGPNKKQDGIEFFASLLPLLDPTLQTILCGDFNTVVDASIDRRGCNASSPWAYNWPSTLANLTSEMDLHDIWRLRHPTRQEYTWHRPDGSQASRLDMFWLSSSLLDHVTSISILPFFRSDHSYVYLKLGLPSDIVRGPGLWKLNASLLADPDFNQMINSFWQEWQAEKSEYPSLTVWWDAGKQFLRQIIRDFSKTKARARNSHLNQLTARLNQLTLRQSRGELVSALIREVKQDIDLEHVHRANGAKIRAKEVWAEEGEKSSRYFFCREKSRGVKRVIRGIKTFSGTIVRSIASILHVWVLFYVNLFSAAKLIPADQDFFLDSLSLKLTPAESDLCEGIISEAECHAALLTFKSHKSPGVDGLTYEFYKRFWDLLGADMVAVFNESLTLGKLALSQRTGIITLLFKKGNRLDPKNWRPISLLCTDYKILAKVLTFRLKSVIASVISPMQTCGIPGRFSGESVRLFQDAIEYANSENIGGALLSLDQEKAFDRVDWDFMLKVLHRMNFGPSFLSWVRLLYTSIYSRVLVNGHLSELFPVHRGVRQGCPLSPLLYVLVSETIGRAILDCPDIDGFLLPDRSVMKLGQYADDTSVFVRSDGSMAALFALFTRFERASGAKLNVNKSHGLLYGSWRPRNDLPFPLLWSNTSITILGCSIGHNISYPWSPLVEKFNSQLSLWKKRDLTLHGRALVANTVGLSLFWYHATIFDMPKTVISSVSKLLFPFVWQKGHEPLARSSVTQPFLSGGLGVVDVGRKVYSLRAIWIRRIFSGLSTHPWKVFLAYHIDRVFHQDLESFFARERVPAYLVRKLPPFYASLVHTWVAVRGGRVSAAWVVPRPNAPPLPVEELTASFTYRTLSCAEHVDHRCFAKFRTLNMSVAWSDVWQSLNLWRFVRSVRDTAWCSFHGILPTADRLLRFKMKVSPLCHCGQNETMVHLFTSCPFAHLIWRWFHTLLALYNPHVTVSPADLLFGFSQSSGVPVAFSALLGVLRHQIWLTRNRHRFDQAKPCVDTCLSAAKSTFRFMVKLESRHGTASTFTSRWLGNGALGHLLGRDRIKFHRLLC